MEIPSNVFSAEWKTQGSVIYDLALCGALSVMRFRKICVPWYVIDEHKCASPSIFCAEGHHLYQITEINSENIWTNPFTRHEILRFWVELGERESYDMGWVQTIPRKSWLNIGRRRHLLPFEVRGRNEMRNWTSAERTKRERCRDMWANVCELSKRLSEWRRGKMDGIDS
jgi:hypothetical protein